MPSASPSLDSARRRRAWKAVEWLLLAVWLAAAALVMAHRRAGFLTNHGADLTQPVWTYIAFRSASQQSPVPWRRRLATMHPLLLSGLLFAACAATEFSQRFWPHGIFPGVYDPLDLLAYAVGLALGCAADLRWPIPPRVAAEHA